MSCVPTFAAHSNSFVHNDVIRYPSLSAELAQKSRQTLVAKISSHTRLTVPPFFSILISWFFSFCCNQYCFVHTRKHPPNVERLVYVQTCNINVRLSIEHHNVFFLLKMGKTRRIRNVPSTRAAFPTARLCSLQTHAIKSGRMPNKTILMTRCGELAHETPFHRGRMLHSTCWARHCQPLRCGSTSHVNTTSLFVTGPTPPIKKSSPCTTSPNTAG